MKPCGEQLKISQKKLTGCIVFDLIEKNVRRSLRSPRSPLTIHMDLIDLFGLSEKHTKFEKNLPYGFDKSADLLSKGGSNYEIFRFVQSFYNLVIKRLGHVL